MSLSCIHNARPIDCAHFAQPMSHHCILNSSKHVYHTSISRRTRAGGNCSGTDGDKEAEAEAIQQQRGKLTQVPAEGTKERKKKQYL